jgi:A/G-specific adenine glycosylase
MDYGAYLKSTVGNLNKLSKSYSKQSAFHGSRRQLRGAIIRELTAGPRIASSLAAALGDDRFEAVLADLEREGMIMRADDMVQLS